MSHPDADPIGSVVDRFRDFKALLDAHLMLLQVQSEEGDAPTCLQAASEFIQRARQTGAILDEVRLREQCRVMVNHWAASLIRAGRRAPETVLETLRPDQLPLLPEESCPYVGPRPFTEMDTARYFGREAWVQKLLERMQRQVPRPLLLFGEAACGKTSLVQAGLLPRLRADGQHHLLHVLRLGPQLLEDFPLPTDRPAVVIVDQAEDLSRITDPALVARLDWRLAEISRRSALLLIARVEHVPFLLRKLHIELDRVELPPPDLTALRQMIERPAETVGLRLEAAVVERLAEETAAIRAGLPLMQLTLCALFSVRDRDRIREQEYQRVAGPRKLVQHELAVRAEELYQSLEPASRAGLADLLKEMAFIDEQGQIVRKRLTATSSMAGPVLEHLVAKGLAICEGERIELIHESLGKNWDRLWEWLVGRQEREEQARREARLRQWLCVAGAIVLIAIWALLATGFLLQASRQHNQTLDIQKRVLQEVNQVDQAGGMSALEHAVKAVDLASRLTQRDLVRRAAEDSLFATLPAAATLVQPALPNDEVPVDLVIPFDGPFKNRALVATDAHRVYSFDLPWGREVQRIFALPGDKKNDMVRLCSDGSCIARVPDGKESEVHVQALLGGQAEKPKIWSVPKEVNGRIESIALLPEERVAILLSNTELYVWETRFHNHITIPGPVCRSLTPLTTTLTGILFPSANGTQLAVSCTDGVSIIKLIKHTTGERQLLMSSRFVKDVVGAIWIQFLENEQQLSILLDSGRIRDLDNRAHGESTSPTPDKTRYQVDRPQTMLFHRDGAKQPLVIVGTNEGAHLFRGKLNMPRVSLTTGIGSIQRIVPASSDHILLLGKGGVGIWHLRPIETSQVRPDDRHHGCDSKQKGYLDCRGPFKLSESLQIHRSDGQEDRVYRWMPAWLRAPDLPHKDRISISQVEEALVVEREGYGKLSYPIPSLELTLICACELLGARTDAAVCKRQAPSSCNYLK